jgi:hypothetical protein
MRWCGRAPDGVIGSGDFLAERRANGKRVMSDLKKVH